MWTQEKRPQPEEEAIVGAQIGAPPASAAEDEELLAEQEVFGHQRLDAAGSKEGAQAAHQMNEEPEYLLHGDSMRSIVVFDKPAALAWA